MTQQDFTTLEFKTGQREALECPSYVSAEPPMLDANASKVFLKRYRRKDEKGEPLETVAGTFYRVAYVVGGVEGMYNKDQFAKHRTIEEFYHLLARRDFFPNSPTWTGAGTPLGQLAACFVLPVEDEMGRGPDGIFSTLRNAALIQQTGGGNGFSFSNVRPKGSLVASSNGKATGPLGFLKVYDAAFGEIAQGGSRRGANMGVMRVDHPDIEDFIRLKEKEGDIANFNISVALTDKFMLAVDRGSNFPLTDPNTGETVRWVNARSLFDDIVKYAHHNGEPGALFIDRANRDNPVPHRYTLEATNPCGEQWLGPYESCCLGSINLANFITKNTYGTKVLDWEALADTVNLATRFLDNVIDANNFVEEVPQLRQAALDSRRIGLGIMGLADVLYQMDVPYGSQTGRDLAAQIMEWVRYHTMVESIRLAKERGPFLAFAGSIYGNDFTWQKPPAISTTGSWGRPYMDWEVVVRGIRQYGIRNAAQTTIAPTGTISTVAGCEGYGCEPVFALGYTRTVQDETGEFDMEYLSPLFKEKLQEMYSDGLLTSLEWDLLREHAAKYGSIADVDPEDFNEPSEVEHLKKVFTVSADVTPQQHVDMQAALQAWVDNSISKTCNFPAGATTTDVKAAYWRAWMVGCKGLTVYVTGSRDKVVLKTQESGSKPTEASTGTKPQVPAENSVEAHTPSVGASGQHPHPDKRVRGIRLSGSTTKVETPLGTAYVTLNTDEAGEPFEAFVNVGKAGSAVSSLAEAIGRLVSYILRMPVSISPSERLEEVIRQLASIGSSRPQGFGRGRVYSLPDGIAKALNTEGKKEPEPVEHSPLGMAATGDLGDICPECGEGYYVEVEGCRKCLACGYSEC